MIWKKLDYINEGRDSFYPYERLEKHSRVVIMGAWRYGRKLIEYIRRTNYFEIVLVVDNNYDAYNELDFDIQPVSKILDIKYDYIILGSLVYSTVESMKQDLRGLGITNNIVSVTSEDIAFDRIPFLCSEDKK